MATRLGLFSAFRVRPRGRSVRLGATLPDGSHDPARSADRQPGLASWAVSFPEHTADLGRMKHDSWQREVLARWANRAIMGRGSRGTLRASFH